MGVPLTVIAAAPGGAQAVPSTTGLKGGEVVAVVGDPTVLDGVVTTLGAVLAAAVVEVVLAAVAGAVVALAWGVVAGVDVVLAAAPDEEDVDVALLELVEHPDAPSARTIATRSDHLKAEDLMSLSPIFSARRSSNRTRRPRAAAHTAKNGEQADAHVWPSSPRFLTCKPLP
jgi:hypothetical protein